MKITSNERDRLAFALLESQRKASSAIGTIGIHRAFGYLEQAVLEIVRDHPSVKAAWERQKAVANA
jgi:hypothetical protein